MSPFVGWVCPLPEPSSYELSVFARNRSEWLARSREGREGWALDSGRGVAPQTRALREGQPIDVRTDSLRFKSRRCQRLGERPNAMRGQDFRHCEHRSAPLGRWSLQHRIGFGFCRGARPGEVAGVCQRPGTAGYVCWDHSGTFLGPSWDLAGTFIPANLRYRRAHGKPAFIQKTVASAPDSEAPAVT